MEPVWSIIDRVLDLDPQDRMKFEWDILVQADDKDDFLPVNSLNRSIWIDNWLYSARLLFI
jgi:hypothetical protein